MPDRTTGASARPLLLPLLLLSLMLPVPATAGAWLRDTGAVFLSFGLDSDPAGLGQTAFAEYGLSPDLTLGLDGWRSAGGDWALLAVATRPLGDTARRLRLSYSIGAGAGRSGGVTSARGRLGAHLGMGLKNGWLASDLTATWRGDTGAIDTKATATWGRNLGARCSSVLEGRAEGSGSLTLAPSLACRVAPALRLRIGGAWEVTGKAPARFGLQTWVDF